MTNTAALDVNVQLLVPGDIIEVNVVKYGRWATITYTVESVYVGMTDTTVRVNYGFHTIPRVFKNTANVRVIHRTTDTRFPL